MIYYTVYDDMLHCLWWYRCQCRSLSLQRIKFTCNFWSLWNII